MTTEISVIILTKDESPRDVSNCISFIQPYVNEVIVIDSSSSQELSKTVLEYERCKYYNKQIGDSNINGFDDLRNFGHVVSANKWCLHVDVDEIFPDTFFSQADNILSTKHSNAYAFPRINLPFYERYPDYQVRLINKTNAEWINKIHEKVDIFVNPIEIAYLKEHHIIHKVKTQKEKLETNKRWSLLSKEKNILIASLFKDSEKYIDRFLVCLKKLILFSKRLNYNIELCFIEGNSGDNTYSILKNWLNKQGFENQDIRYTLKKIDLPTMDRFISLSILRNMLINIGLKNYHDYVLMIDSDIIFDYSLLHELIKRLEEYDCDVLAPMPFIENFRDYEMEYFYDSLAFIDENNIHFMHTFPYCSCITDKIVKSNEEDTSVKMSSVGTCYVIKADIYNINDFKDLSISRCYDDLRYKIPMTYGNLDDPPISEQISFFMKLKERGYSIYTATDLRILHINLEGLGASWH